MAYSDTESRTTVSENGSGIDLEGLSAVTSIYRRRIGSEAGYWLRTIGYEVRDTSVSNRVYMWYLLIFGAFWLFGMWAVAVQFASGTGSILSEEFRTSLINAIPYAVALLQVGLVVRAVMDIPLKLSFKDMEYIAVSPVSRAAIVLVRYLWTSVSRVGIITLLGTILIMTIAWRFASDSGGIAGLQAFLILLPLAVLMRAIAWSVGLLRAVYPRLDRQRYWLWLAPLAAVPLGYGFGLIVAEAARGNITILHIAAVILLALGMSFMLVWLGQRVNMMLIIDESQTFARIGELGLMAWTAPDLAQQVRQQVRLSSRPARERLPAVRGDYMLITRAMIHFSRRPLALLSQAAWGALVAVLAVQVLVLQLDLGPIGYAAAAIFMVFSVPRGITELFSIDMNEPFLRRMIPAGNLQLLLTDAAFPLLAIMLGATMVWVTQVQDYTMLVFGVVMIIGLGLLLLMCRGLSLIESKALPFRFEFLPTILVCVAVIALGASMGGLSWAAGATFMLVAILSQFVAVTG